MNGQQERAETEKLFNLLRADMQRLDDRIYDLRQERNRIVSRLSDLESAVRALKREP